MLLQQRGDNGQWGFPGGAVEPGERLQEAAVREIREETGLEVQVDRLIGVYTDPDMVYPNGDRAHSICIGVTFRVLGGELRCDGAETQALRYFPLTDTPPLFCGQHERILRDVCQKSYGVID